MGSTVSEREGGEIGGRESRVCLLGTYTNIMNEKRDK
jgi:hypothetical protein